MGSISVHFHVKWLNKLYSVAQGTWTKKYLKSTHNYHNNNNNDNNYNNGRTVKMNKVMQDKELIFKQAVKYAKEYNIIFKGD